MINTHDILQTINMIQDENLDIRTITMGISLLDCCTGDAKSTCDKIIAANITAQPITSRSDKLSPKSSPPRAAKTDSRLIISDADVASV